MMRKSRPPPNGTVHQPNESTQQTVALIAKAETATPDTNKPLPSSSETKILATGQNHSSDSNGSLPSSNRRTSAPGPKATSDKKIFPASNNDTQLSPDSKRPSIRNTRANIVNQTIP